MLEDPPVKALFVYNSNPAAVCPNHNEVVRGLLRPDLFTVVHEQFFTDTTDYADIVLPATTFFEQRSCRLLTVTISSNIRPGNRAAGRMPLECGNLSSTLAQRMGFEDTCFNDSVDQMIDQALVSPNPWLRGIDRARLERESHVRLEFGDQYSAKADPFLPFANGKFSHQSGKAELYSESLKARGLDPVLEFIPPTESRHTHEAGRLSFGAAGA